MLINQAPAAGLANDTPWSDLYERAADESTDYVSEVRSAVEYGLSDPEDSVQMACAAAETAGAEVEALSSPWSLYTPQDAATVTSALFVQLQHNADALTELGRAVGRIVERGEAELPAPAGAGQSANLSDALEALRAVSGTLHDLVARHASTTVRALYAAPGSAPLPADAHAAVVAVAGLLAEQYDGAVTLNTRHEDGAYVETDDGLGCGCGITIVGDGETYDFHRGDSDWSLSRESDGRKLSNGSMVFSTWETLSTSLRSAHPQQLADDVLCVIAADQA
ncbi:hypothetical protein ABZ349_29825 [Streptomyces niveus]|uniref:hypothetical protein n=1 Tax=Streptomyces niveus TaxID=193462 RepID=UPI003407F46E